MTKNHRKKAAARRAAARTGTTYTTAAAGTAHEHPAPDLADILPTAAGRRPDTALAQAVVAACRAMCRPCQDAVIPRVRADVVTAWSLTRAALLTPLPRPVAPEFAERERIESLTAFEELSADDRAALLEDALDMWAGGDADVEIIRLDLDQDDLHENGTDGPADVAEPGTYSVVLGQVVIEGRELPVLVLAAQSGTAGLEDLRARTGWPQWDRAGWPPVDIRWRLRADIAGRYLEELVHTDDEGWDDEELWVASERVPLPDVAWNLLDRTEHVLVVGPAAGVEAIDDPAVPLLATIARVRFL